MKKAFLILYCSIFSLIIFAQDSMTAIRRKELTQQLDSIYVSDQKYRRMISETMSKYGDQSTEKKTFWKVIISNDSINLIKVIKILNQYGWLGSNVIGLNGNQALFLVIQHSNLTTMEKYLPMMIDALNKGNASSQDCALLQDRIEMLNKRPQIYGTQVQMKNGKYEVYKIIDEANVDKRRAEVGLGPLDEYLENWNIKYNH